MDALDRRKVDKLREFFRQIPFLSVLPRRLMTNLHLSMTKKRYKRGQVVCKEGDPSDYLFIVCKGEFEVSKVVDMSKVHQIPDYETKGKNC